LRDYEYQLLDAIADNPTVTQAGLAAQLGVAVLARRTAEYMEQSLVVYRNFYVVQLWKRLLIFRVRELNTFYYKEIVTQQIFLD
jgi:hypothetical protein